MSNRQVSVRQAATGEWMAYSAAPHSLLRGMIVGPYMGWQEATEGVVQRIEVPTLFIPLILTLEGRFNVDGIDRASFFAGLSTHHSIVVSSGVVECLQVNLSIDAASRLMAQRLGALAEGIHDVGCILGVEGRRLIEQLGNASSWPSRFALLDGYLLPRLINVQGLSQETTIALNGITSKGGVLQVGELARKVGVTHKQLIRRFKHEIGLTPKHVARVQRFSRALSGLSQSSRNLALAAIEAGYSDQAHFNRDFKAFSGMTPVTYLKGLDPEMAKLQAF